MTKSMKLAGVALAVLTVASAPNAFARQGADDPVGHVRQEDRQADRAATPRSAGDVRQEDRATQARQGADDPAGHIRRSRGADDPVGHR
jgi:hypothetical protein